MKSDRGLCTTVLVGLAALILACPSATQADERETPGRYFVDYPAAEQFCPPIRTAFRDAATTARVVKGRRINQHPNAGTGSR